MDYTVYYNNRHDFIIAKAPDLRHVAGMEGESAKLISCSVHCIDNLINVDHLWHPAVSQPSSRGINKFESKSIYRDSRGQLHEV